MPKYRPTKGERTYIMRRAASSLPTAIFALALGVLGSCANMFEKSPSAVVQAFLAAANEGRYSDAQEMLSEGGRNVDVNSERGQRAGGIRGICDQITKNGSIAKVVIVKEEIRGEGAVVTADVTFKDGSIVKGDQNPIPLIKEKGAWKLTLGPAPSSPAAAAPLAAPHGYKGIIASVDATSKSFVVHSASATGADVTLKVNDKSRYHPKGKNWDDVKAAAKVSGTYHNDGTDNWALTVKLWPDKAAAAPPKAGASSGSSEQPASRPDRTIVDLSGYYQIVGAKPAAFKELEFFSLNQT